MSAADVVAWLRSPEGEQWSRRRGDGGPAPLALAAPYWRATGPLDAASDPCGRPPERVAVRTAT